VPIAGPADIDDMALGTDALGNGVLIWTEDQRDIHAAAFSERPPSIGAVAITPDTISLRISEPARLRITLRARGRAATQRTAIRRAGRTVLALTPAMRRIARTHTFSATIRAQDAGPRASRRTIHIRR
jgi:hypothetical protein